MSDAPYEIWAHENAYGDRHWWGQPDKARVTVKYIRADISAARIADLERQLAEARTDAEQAVALAYQRAADEANRLKPSWGLYDDGTP